MANISLTAILAVAVLVAVCGAQQTKESLSDTIGADGQGKRLLALLDSYSMRETHSSFIKQLRDRGFTVTLKAADDADLALTKYSEHLYDHLLLLCPNVVEFGGNMSTKSVVDFIDAGGNVLVAGSSEMSEPIREIAAECGIEYGDEKTQVIDQFNVASKDTGAGTLLVVPVTNLIRNKQIAGEIMQKVANNKKQSPFLYRGVGMTSDAENPLVIDVLTATNTAYSYDPESVMNEYPHSIGKATLLVAGLQARNNARVIFTGSVEMFSNEFFESPVQTVKAGSGLASAGDFYEKSGNEDLAKSLTQWVFKERGVLRVVEVNHHLVGETRSPVAYTIKENIFYSVDIEEMVDGKWTPFVAQDVQLEFVRLDPFIRTKLAKSKNNKVFQVEFMCPDVYGVFKFLVDYQRLGYTNLFSSTQVSVRPLEHTQYERFISQAYPYYASAFSMMFAVFAFSFIQLYHSDEPTASKAN
jgi:oligosaccharyltransferase complex subunit beta